MRFEEHSVGEAFALHLTRSVPAFVAESYSSCPLIALTWQSRFTQRGSLFPVAFDRHSSRSTTVAAQSVLSCTEPLQEPYFQPPGPWLEVFWNGFLSFCSHSFSVPMECFPAVVCLWLPPKPLSATGLNSAPFGLVCPDGFLTEQPGTFLLPFAGFVCFRLSGITSPSFDSFDNASKPLVPSLPAVDSWLMR